MGVLDCFGTRSWIEPAITGIGRLPARVPLVPSPSMSWSDASPWLATLDGQWSFRLVKNPDVVTEAMLHGPDGSKPWTSIVVPGTWQTQGHGQPWYTNTLYPFDNEPPNVPIVDNPTGVHVTTIRPLEAYGKGWSRRRTILRVGGADSCHYVFVNGRPVGMGKDTRLTSEYDITDHLRAGHSSTLAIVVARWSDATWLEDQDQWWLSGITRSVELVSVPKTHLFDVRAAAGLTDDLTNGTLDLDVEVRFAKAPERDWTVRAHVIDDAGEVQSIDVVAEDLTPPLRFPRSTSPNRRGVSVLEQTVPTFDRRTPRHSASAMDQFPGHRVQWSCVVPRIAPWSTEEPVLSTLVVELRNPTGTLVDRVVQRIGFRRVEIDDRALLINGKPVLIKGVNRHDHNPQTGCVVSREDMRADLVLMKQMNLNAVRTSHYPSDPYLYDVADELGLYVIAEANVETHGRYRHLLHDPIWMSACLERMSRMVRRDRNHASIIGWSLGNESGYAPIHDAMAALTRKLDPTRFVHCEGPSRYFEQSFRGTDGRTPGDWDLNGQVATDVTCPMYPSIDAIVAWSRRGIDRRPLIMCEFSHAMGNSNGSLADYWDAIRSHEGLQGGFLWEWWDHGIDATRLPNGRVRTGLPIPAEVKRGAIGFSAYGGHFGDEPNDGAFVADGLVWPDRSPHPGLFEARAIWQPIRVSLDNDLLLVTNDRDFAFLDDLMCTYELLVDGIVIESGLIDLPVLPPGTAKAIGIPGSSASHEAALVALENHCTLRFTTRFECGWAPAGHEIAACQVSLPAGKPVRSDPFGLVADVQRPGGANQRRALEIWRPFIDNDGVPDGSLGIAGVRSKWVSWGLPDVETELVHSRVKRDGTIDLKERLRPARSAAWIRHRMTIHHQPGVGSILSQTVDIPKEYDDLPRLGYSFRIDVRHTRLRWFGRGPRESYVDRRNSELIGVWEQLVDEQFVQYLRPQDSGHHVDTRWFEVLADDGSGIRVEAAAGSTLSFGVLPYSDVAIEAAKIPQELKPDDHVWVHVDHLRRGVGTGSCGPDTLAQYRIGPGHYEWSWTLRQITSNA